MDGIKKVRRSEKDMGEGMGRGKGAKEKRIWDEGDGDEEREGRGRKWGGVKGMGMKRWARNKWEKIGRGKWERKMGEGEGEW